MFDLTKEIKLDPKSQKKYNIAQAVLYAVFLIVVFFVADRILFPSVSLVFSFNNVNSLKNTLVSPRTAFSPDTLAKNPIISGEKFIFDANPLGNFSDAAITFSANEDSKNIESSPVSIRKSYQAFFYPISNPMGFKDGTLLTTADGKYFIVSDGLLRKFESIEILLQLGYPKDSFRQVSESDLQYNKPGDKITDKTSYPDNTLFAIGDTYYQLKNQELFPFVSERAFLSQFDAIQAIAKDNDFILRYPVSETPLGFADGTLASSDISVFILSKGKSYPIINAETFVQMGFDWNKVVALDPEELGLYERQKQFTRTQPHPNGTLFLDQETGKFFIIKDKKKHPIESAEIAKTYSKQSPVLANIRQSEKTVSCQLKKSWFSDKYSCHTPLEFITDSPGNDYEISSVFVNDVKLTNLEAKFSTPLTWKNLMLSLSRIKENLRNNYIAPPQ